MAVQRRTEKHKFTQFKNSSTKYVYKDYRYVDNTNYDNVGLLMYKLIY